MRKAVLQLCLLLLSFAVSCPVLAEGAADPGSGQNAGEPAIEIAFWNTVKDTSDPAILQTYLDRYPNGAFAGLARVMMDKLAKEQKGEALQPSEAAPGGGDDQPRPEESPETRFITL